MSEWVDTELGEVADIQIGGTPARENLRFWATPSDDGEPWVSIADLRARHISETKERITRAGIASSNVKLVPAETLLMSFKLSIGRAAIAKVPLYTNEAIAAIRPNDEKLAASLLYYILPSIAKNAITDTAIKGSTLNKKSLAALEIRFPKSSNRQKKIAAILETMDEAIEHTQALIGKYEQVKAGMMQDLFTRGLTPGGKLRPPRDKAPDLYQETPIGWIPKDWQVQLLEALTKKIVDGIHHRPDYVDQGVPFVTVKNLTQTDTIDFSDTNFVDWNTHLQCKARANAEVGDVLVTKDGTLGVSRIIKDWMPEFSIFVSVALLKPNDEISSEWLHLFFDSGAYLKQLPSLSAGSGLQHIHLEHFRKFRIPLPESDEQLRISKKVDMAHSVISAEMKTLQKLRQQKSGLMQDLLTGKVPVKV